MIPPLSHRLQALAPTATHFRNPLPGNGPGAYLVAESFEKHDRNRFAIFGYSYGPDDRSPMRHRLVNAFDRLVDVRDSFVHGSRKAHCWG